MKKLLALLLALVLCVAMACPALAVEGETGESVGVGAVEGETGGTDDGFVKSDEENPPPPVDPDSPSGPDQPTTGPGDEGMDVPETGDQSPENTALLAGLMVISFVGIVVVSTILWKNRERSKA